MRVLRPSRSLVSYVFGVLSAACGLMSTMSACSSNSASSSDGGSAGQGSAGEGSAGEGLAGQDGGAGTGTDGNGGGVMGTDGSGVQVGDSSGVTPTSDSGGAPATDGSVGTSTDSGGGAGNDSGLSGPAASQTAGGAACPSLTGTADKAYPRWPMPNPPAANLPNPFSYTDNGNGTVTDHVTGLVWQKVVSGSATFADAPAYCSGLTLAAPAGYTWQVPTRIQLLSIVDYTTGAAVDAPFLGNKQPPGGMYTWTSTPWVVSQLVDAGKPQDAWMVNFGGGGGLTSNAAGQSETEWIRCVAAPAVTPLPYPHYVQVDTGEVGDVETGLIWAQASNNTAYLKQTAAVAYCAGLGLNGHTWRLPSVTELASLVDDNPNIKKVSPAIDQCVFADTSPKTYYMSSSLWGTTPWGLNYEDGFTFNTEPQLPDAGDGVPGGYVKCVR